MRCFRLFAILTLSALLFASCHAVPSAENLLAHTSDVSTAIIWVAEDATDKDVAELEKSLRTLSNIQTVRFLSEEEALSEFADIIPEETFESLQSENNPMQDAFQVTFIDTSMVEQTALEIHRLPFVEDVSFPSDVAAVYAAFPAPIRYLISLYQKITT